MVMTRVQRKIEDRSGASLSVALLFFLVCAIVGSVLIAAASVSMGRMKGIEQGEQERYAVDSAMELIAAKMQGGSVSFQASMDRKDVQIFTEYDEDEDTTHEDKIEYNLYSLTDWKLKNLSTTERKDAKGDSLNDDTNNGLLRFREEVAQKIFEHYLEKQSVYDSTKKEDIEDKHVILGSWYPSSNKFQNLKDSLEDDGESDEIEEFTFGTPGTIWPSDIDTTPDFLYITTQPKAGGANVQEKPFTMEIGSHNIFKVNVLFAMDSQFNITAVIYPYKKGTDASPDMLKDATVYRVVMIPCINTSLNFDPVIKEKIVSSEKKTVTTVSVQHMAKLSISWGQAVKSSVIETPGDNYPRFFPQQFKSLLSSEITTPTESDG